MVHYDAILNNVLEFGTAEKKLKECTLYGAFWRYWKQNSLSW